MSEITVNLNPIGREEIHRLEAALLIGTLFRPEVLEMLRESGERLTWVDSLAVAAGAIARERAKMTIPRIAEELGRTEATIRNHLAGKTKAGQLVRQTLQKFIKEGVKLEIAIPTITLEEIDEMKKELEQLKSKLAEEEKTRIELENKLKNIKEELKKILEKLT